MNTYSRDELNTMYIDRMVQIEDLIAAVEAGPIKQDALLLALRTSLEEVTAELYNLNNISAEYAEYLEVLIEALDNPDDRETLLAARRSNSLAIDFIGVNGRETVTRRG